MSEATETKRSTWTQRLTAELGVAFSSGLANAREHMKEKHGIPQAMVDAKLAEMKMIVLSAADTGRVMEIAAWFKALDPTSRGLAMKQLRAELKEPAEKTP